MDRRRRFCDAVLLPALRGTAPSERLARFDAVERYFAWQARLTTLLAGISGFYVTTCLDLWDRFRSASFWWVDAMVLVWLIFTAMLFVEGTLFVRRWLHMPAAADPDGIFRPIERWHRALLALS